jgi:DNA-directed RNA polymerase specialized sigma54-like protein
MATLTKKERDGLDELFMTMSKKQTLVEVLRSQKKHLKRVLKDILEHRKLFLAKG